MQVQQIQTKQQNQKQTPHFNGVADSVFRYLATNQAVGANGVDLCFMVMPRTASDAIRRGPNAGLETGRRESMGLINDTCIGVYGASSGAIIAAAMGLDKKYGEKLTEMIDGKAKKIHSLRVNSIHAAPETINILAENKAKQFKNNTEQIDYLKETLHNLKAFNPAHKNSDADGYVKLSDETIEKVANYLEEAINNKKLDFRTWDKNTTPEGKQAIINIITEDTGAQSKYKLRSLEKSGQESIADLKRLIEDIFVTSKAFNTKPVEDAFREQIKNSKGIQDNAFIKSITKYMKLKSGVGFAMAAAVGVSAQPINMYITRKKTGSDGFVGVEGRKKNNSLGFKLLKGFAGFAAMIGMLASMKCNFKQPLKLPKEFMEKMAFKGFWPTVHQLMGVYGVTIISRILSTRDEDELRESVTKDTLGFTSWLILGDIVNRIVAEKADNSVMSRTKEVENSKNFWKKVFNSTIKTRDEVAIEELKKSRIKSTKTVDGRTVAKSFKEMLKEFEKTADTQARKVLKKRLRTLNIAQLSGYLFSGLVLGLGIPNLNIAITNALDKKRKAKAASQGVKTPAA